MIGKTFKRKASNGSSHKKPGSKTEQYVKSVIRSTLSSREQQKWATQTSTITSISTSIAFFDFSTISQGTTSNTRVGTAISPKSAHFRGQFILGDTTNIVRFFIFRWHPDNNSDNPQVSEFLVNTTDPLSGFVHFKNRRFTVLYDTLLTLDTYHPTFIFDKEMELGGNLTFTNSNSGAEHLYIAAISDSGSVAHPTLNMLIDFVWVDKY